MDTLFRRRASLGALSGAVIALTTAIHGQQRGVQPSKLARAPMIQPPPPGEIEVLPVRGNIYVLFGAGANIVASVGGDGVLLVDAGSAAMSDKVLAALADVQRD